MSIDAKETTLPDNVHCRRCGQETVSWTMPLDSPICVHCQIKEFHAREEAAHARFARMVFVLCGLSVLVAVAVMGVLS